MVAGDGNDVLNGGNGADELSGGAGNDKLTAGNGSDEVYGGDGNDHLIGGSGDDLLSGGRGDDKINAGEGDDTILVSEGDDTINGGNGNDTAVMDGSIDDYTYSMGKGTTVTINHSDGSQTQVENVENFRFADSGDEVELSTLQDYILQSDQGASNLDSLNGESSNDFAGNWSDNIDDSAIEAADNDSRDWTEISGDDYSQGNAKSDDDDTDGKEYANIDGDHDHDVATPGPE